MGLFHRGRKPFYWCVSQWGYSDDAIKQALETYVHGLSWTVKHLRNVCRISDFVNLLGIVGVCWDVNNATPLNRRSILRYDYVVGNPPYVRCIT